MNKTQSLIYKTFRSLPDINAGWGRNHVERLFDMCEAAERQHRKGRPSCVPSPRGFSCADAGRYFAVKYLHGYASGKDRMPAISSVLDIRAECIYAAAMAERYPQLKEWAATVPAEFLALDYCDLVK